MRVDHIQVRYFKMFFLYKKAGILILITTIKSWYLSKVFILSVPKTYLFLKLQSYRANGRETDKKSFHPFVSGRIRFMSVSNPVNLLLVR